MWGGKRTRWFATSDGFTTRLGKVPRMRWDVGVGWASRSARGQKRSLGWDEDLRMRQSEDEQAGAGMGSVRGASGPPSPATSLRGERETSGAVVVRRERVVGHLSAGRYDACMGVPRHGVLGVSMYFAVCTSYVLHLYIICTLLYALPSSSSMYGTFQYLCTSSCVLPSMCLLRSIY